MYKSRGPPEAKHSLKISSSPAIYALRAYALPIILLSSLATPLAIPSETPVAPVPAAATFNKQPGAAKNISTLSFSELITMLDARDFYEREAAHQELLRRGENDPQAVLKLSSEKKADREASIEVKIRARQIESAINERLVNVLIAKEVAALEKSFKENEKKILANIAPTMKNFNSQHTFTRYEDVCAVVYERARNGDFKLSRMLFSFLLAPEKTDIEAYGKLGAFLCIKANDTADKHPDVIQAYNFMYLYWLDRLNTDLKAMLALAEIKDEKLLRRLKIVLKKDIPAAEVKQRLREVQDLMGQIEKIRLTVDINDLVHGDALDLIGQALYDEATALQNQLDGVQALAPGKSGSSSLEHRQRGELGKRLFLSIAAKSLRGTDEFKRRFAQASLPATSSPTDALFNIDVSAISTLVLTHPLSMQAEDYHRVLTGRYNNRFGVKIAVVSNRYPSPLNLAAHDIKNVYSDNGVIEPDEINDDSAVFIGGSFSECLLNTILSSRV